MKKKKWILDWNNINYIKIIKIAVGSSIAILIADLFGLQYSASAGIITLLSIQDTKKETLFIAGKRFLAFLFAIIIAFVLFESFGYRAITFGAFLLLFVGGSYLFGLQDGISMCSVLTSHFLIEKNMELSFIGNEIIIMMIGTMIGVLLNLYMPKNTEDVKADMRLIEDEIKGILKLMAMYMLENNQIETAESQKQTTDKQWDHNCGNICSIEENLHSLEDQLKEALSRAYDNMNNTLLSDTRYYIQYFVMRRDQCNALNRIQEQLCLLNTVPKQAIPISKFIRNIGEHFHEYNNAEMLLEELEMIRIRFKGEENPITRDEFENRAVLFLILNDIKNFLMIKRNFVHNMEEKQLQKYWKINH